MNEKPETQTPAPPVSGAAHGSPLCKDCIHMSARYQICTRPVQFEYSLVTGEKIPISLHASCEAERRKVTRFARFMGCDSCGVEARYFKAASAAAQQALTTTSTTQQND